MNYVVTSRPGLNKTLVKRSSGKTLVNERSEIVRESNCSKVEYKRSNWITAAFARLVTEQSCYFSVCVWFTISLAYSHILFPEAEPFVPGQREHGTPKQQTTKKRRSRRRRRSAGNAETSSNNVLDKTLRMAKTPTGGMSCETKTKSLAYSNWVSKAKTPKTQL